MSVIEDSLVIPPRNGGGDVWFNSRMAFEAIFFDLFNTVLRFDYEKIPEVEFEGKRMRTTSVAVHRMMRERFGVGCPFEDFLREALDTRRQIVQMWGDQHREFPCLKRFELLAERLGLENGPAAAMMVETHMEQMFQMMFLPDENRLLLDRLDGFPLVLASNFDHAATARRALGEFGLESRFDFVFISEEVGWRKPGEKFFRAILDETGFSPPSCLYVGDDPVADVWGATQFGFQVAWLAGEREERPPAPPRWRLRALPEILALTQRRT